MAKRQWSDAEIKEMREQASRRVKRREICRQFGISGGHLERVLSGMSRTGAGGPLISGEILDTVVNGMTEAQVNEQHKEALDRLEEVQRRREEREKSELPSERALGYGARTIADRFSPGFVERMAKIQQERELRLSPSGVPLPPDFEEFAVPEESVVKQSDADLMIDELMKK